MSEETRPCPDCGGVRRPHRFGVRPSGKATIRYICSPCRRQKLKSRDPEGFLAKRREFFKRYAAKPENRRKIRARNKIKHLCRMGKIKRGLCEGCGSPHTQAHHDDYSRPLDVRWLCSACHGAEHRLSA